MPTVEIVALIAVFLLSFTLLVANFDAALSLLLVLSVLLHKEFFSIYSWDLLPVRMFMLAFSVFSFWKVTVWLKENKLDWIKIKQFCLQPFILLLFSYWFVNGLSLLFTENLKASVLFFSFQTTIMVLGVVLYQRLKRQPEKVLSLIKTYIFVAFAITLFGFVQLAVYEKTGFIFGALWNIPGRLARIGATFWDVNHFAAFLAALLPVLGMLVLASRGWRKKITYILMFLPMATMLLMTSSRSGWIIAFVAFLSFLIIILIKKWGIKGVYGLLLVLTIISAAGGIEYSNRSSPFRKRIKDYFHYRIDSFDSHFLLLTGAWQIFEDYPYLGGGTGGFFEKFSKTEIAPVYFGRDPVSLTSGFRAPGHSIWGELVAETGGVGIFVFILFVLVALLPLLHLALTEEENKTYLLAAGMFSSLLGWFVAGVFYSYKAEFFWLIFFLYSVWAVGIYGGMPDYNKIISSFFRSNKFVSFCLLVIAATLIFSGLGKNSFIAWDEAIYAKIAKNIVNSGEIITQQWDLGSPWFEKPPLYMWLAALSMKIFTIGEFAARFPSALLGLFTVYLVYLFGKKLFNKTAAFVSAIALVTTTQFLYYSRASMLDVSVTFFTTLAIYFYYKVVFEKDNVKNWALIGLAVGFAAMIKNVVGFLPFVVIGVHEIYLLLSKQKTLSAEVVKKYLISFGVALLIFLPWHAEMLRRYGFAFIDNYFIYHIFTRVTSEIEQKGEAFFWYVIVLKVSMRIWFVALLGAFPYAIYKIRNNNKKSIFLMTWALVVFLFFSVSRSKIVWYIVPLYPVLALFVGDFVRKVYEYLSSKISYLSLPWVKGMFLYCVAFFALFYLFLVKGLVYREDATRGPAELLAKKDEVFGLTLPVYVDKVELPLIKYYTDGEYVDTDYRQLKKKLDNPKYNEKIVFVTKESRLEDLKEKNPNIELVKNVNDHSLGNQNSEHERDTLSLSAIEKELNDLQALITDKTIKGKQVTVTELNRRQYLLLQQEYWANKIEVGLSSVPKD